MEESEFDKRAAADAAFRRAKLDELRYFRNVGAGTTWFCVIVAVGFSIYGGITRGRWTVGYELLFIAAVCAVTTVLCKTRIAALQSLDERRG
jgi:hypothetical protein